MSDRKRIGLKDVRAFAPNTIIHDSDVLGFAAQRQQVSVSYVLRYRTAEGRQRWYTIGRHGSPWTPDQARDEARRVLGEVAKGMDPLGAKKARRGALTVSQLCDEYVAAVEEGRLLTRSGRSKKASTMATDKGRIEGHIKPLLGTIAVTAQGFLHGVAAGKTVKRAKTAATRGLSVVRGGRGNGQASRARLALS